MPIISGWESRRLQGSLSGEEPGAIWIQALYIITIKICQPTFTSFSRRTTTGLSVIVPKFPTLTVKAGLKRNSGRIVLGAIEHVLQYRLEQALQRLPSEAVIAPLLA